MDLLFIPKVIHEHGETRWKDIDKGKPKNSVINLSQSHFVKHKYLTYPGTKPVLRCERLALTT
jgi:hypothetical protein